jgi:hypothetical protein
MLGSLAQVTAAWLLGINARTLRDSPDAPRSADGSYNGQALVTWAVARADASARQARDVDGDLSGAPSPALERYREERAALARMDRLERENVLIPRADVHAAMVRLAVILRGAGERLGRDFGPGAQAVMGEALKAFEAEMEANNALNGGDPKTAPASAVSENAKRKRRASA